jgi:secreted trypsin-like serine protease
MGYKACLTVLLGVCFGILTSTSASPITFGKEVLNARFDYPSVLSVWYREDDDEDFYPICTATLIESRIVLTAAHCIDNEGLYAVGYGSDILWNATLQQVSAVWRHPGYSERQNVNDVGLLLLEKAIPVTPTSLSSKSVTEKAIKDKNKTLEIVGWGKNQNGEIANYLRKSIVKDQSLSLAKYKGWRNEVWLAVGRYISKE